MRQTGQSSCYCERRPLLRSALLVTTPPVSPATPSHMPVSHNCGLIPSFSIIFFLLPVLPLCRCELLIIYLPAFFSLPPSSPLHFFFFFFNLFLSFALAFPLSPSFPSASLLFFPPAASMFLCVNSWDAFVEGFHSDGPFEQVVIHVCWL